MYSPVIRQCRGSNGLNMGSDGGNRYYELLSLEKVEEGSFSGVVETCKCDVEIVLDSFAEAVGDTLKDRHGTSECGGTRSRQEVGIYPTRVVWV